MFLDNVIPYCIMERRVIMFNLLTQPHVRDARWVSLTCGVGIRLFLQAWASCYPTFFPPQSYTMPQR